MQSIQSNQMDPSSAAGAPDLPHNVADLILAFAIRSEAFINPIRPLPVDPSSLHSASASSSPTAALEYVPDSEPNDADDELAATIARCILVAPDLYMAQQTAVVQHPDWSLLEACADGELALVKAWLLTAASAHVLDSDFMHCITAASANGHVHVLDWMYRHARRPFYYTCEAVDEASANRHVDVLAWWLSVSDKLPFRYSAEAMDGASANGELDSLNWWLLESGLKLKYSESAMDLASAGGFVEILDWWYQQAKAGVIGGECEYYSDASLEDAVLAGNVAVLDWWWDHQDDAESDFSFDLRSNREYIFQAAMEHGQLAVFQWAMNKFVPRPEDPICTEEVCMGVTSWESYWRMLEWMHENGLPITERNFANVGDFAASSSRTDALDWLLKISREIGVPMPFQSLLAKASECGHAAVLDWCVQTQLFDPTDENQVFQLDGLAIDHAATFGHVHILDWWMRTVGRDNFKYSMQAMHGASMEGHVAVLQWFKDAEFEFKYDSNSITEQVAECGHVDVLQWWLSNRFDMMYSGVATEKASKNGHVAVLQWFCDVYFRLRFLPSGVNSASYACHLNVLDWWLENHRQGNRAMRFSPSDFRSRDRVHKVQVLDWWKSSGLLGDDQKNFFDMTISDSDTALDQTTRLNSVLPSLTWRKRHGYAVPANEGHLERAAEKGQFDVVECLVDVLGVAPTTDLIENLEEYEGIEHIIDWLRSRMR